MGSLHCCGALRRCVTYSLIPEHGFIIAELNVLDECPVCGHYIVELARIDFTHNLSAVRKTNIKARKLFEKLHNSILYKQEFSFDLSAKAGKFYLNYNEFGKVKRCYSNLYALKIGLKDPYEALNIVNCCAKKII